MILSEQIPDNHRYKRILERINKDQSINYAFSTPNGCIVLVILLGLFITIIGLIVCYVSFSELHINNLNISIVQYIFEKDKLGFFINIGLIIIVITALVSFKPTFKSYVNFYLHFWCKILINERMIKYILDPLLEGGETYPIDSEKLNQSNTQPLEENIVFAFLNSIEHLSNLDFCFELYSTFLRVFPNSKRSIILWHVLKNYLLLVAHILFYFSIEILVEIGITDNYHFYIFSAYLIIILNTIFIAKNIYEIQANSRAILAIWLIILFRDQENDFGMFNIQVGPYKMEYMEIIPIVDSYLYPSKLSKTMKRVKP